MHYSTQLINNSIKFKTNYSDLIQPIHVECEQKSGNFIMFLLNFEVESETTDSETTDTLEETSESMKNLYKDCIFY